LLHHREPGGVPVAVLVDEVVAPGVVWRIDVDALDRAGVLPLEQAQRLVVLAMDEDPADGVVEVAVEPLEEAIDEVLVEVPGVDDEGGMRLEERLVHLALGVEQVLPRIDVEERAPRLELRLVRQDLVPQLAWHVLDQDEPVGAEYELALLEQATRSEERRVG